MGFKFNVFTSTFDIVVEGTSTWIDPVADRASLPTGVLDGTAAVVLDEDTVFTYDSGTDTWHNSRLSLAQFNAATNAEGVSIDSLNTAGKIDYRVNVHPASATTPGVVTTGAQSFAGDKTFTTNVIVEGDFTVNGTTTTVNTETLDVEDANITINKNGTQASADLADAGLTIEMSDATDVVIGYDSTLASRMKLGDSGDLREIATVSHTQTFTNKSIDADNNTITNIDNADIKVGAAIDAAKIHNGTVSNTEFGYLDGVTSSIQTQLDDKANRTLSNLTSPTSINQSLLFNSDLTYDIGDVTNNANKLFVGAIERTSGNMNIDTPAGALLLGALGNIQLTSTNFGINLVTTGGTLRFTNSSPNTIGDVWTATDTAGAGYWAPAPVTSVNSQTGNVVLDADDVSAANQQLSNLTSPTSVNQNLLPSDNTKNIGDFATDADRWNQISGNQFYAGGTGDNGLLQTRNSSNVATGQIQASVTNVSGVANSFGIFSYWDASSLSLLTLSGNAPNPNSNPIYIETGNGSGSGTSGNIYIRTGTSSTTRGNLLFQDGTEGTSGHVWASTDASGSGNWADPNTLITFPVDSVNGQTGVVVLDADDVSAANQQLSNLTSPTAINQNLTFDSALGAAIIQTENNGSGSTNDLTYKSGNAGSGASGSVNIETGTATTTRGDIFLRSRIIRHETGQAQFGDLEIGKTNVTTPTTNFGDGIAIKNTTIERDLYLVTENNPNADAVNSGNLVLETGNLTNGGSSGNSGDIIMRTGSASGSGSRGSIRMIDESILSASNGYIWTLADNTSGRGEWQALSAANTSLSNLTSPTSINQNLFPDNNTRNLGDFATDADRWNQISGNQIYAGGTGDNGLFQTRTTGNVATGQIQAAVGTPSGASNTFGIFAYQASNGLSLFTLNDSPSDPIYIETGNGNNSGDIRLRTGTGTGRGTIVLQNGTEGTANHVWSSSDTSGSGQWVDPNTLTNTSIQTVSTTTTLTSSNLLVLANSGTAAFTITLPAAASHTGRTIKIKKTSSDFNLITVDGNGAETIDGALTKTIATQYEQLVLVSDGSNWFITDRYIDQSTKTFTPTFGALGSGGMASTSGWWSRDGEHMEIRVAGTKDGTNGTGGGNVYIEIPDSRVVDTTKVSSSGPTVVGVNENDASSAFEASLVIPAASTGRVYFSISGANFNAGEEWTLTARIPIDGWDV